MNKEEIKAMIKDCVYSEDGITYMSDKQYNNYIDIIEQLQKENKILRENAEHNDKVVDKVNWENQSLKKENQELKEKLDKYENPEDMTLMMMWCTEKAKDKIKELKDNWNKLKEWIKEYIETNEKWYSSELSNHDKEYYKKDYIDSKFWLMKFQNQMQEIEGGMNG